MTKPRYTPKVFADLLRARADRPWIEKDSFNRGSPEASNKDLAAVNKANEVIEKHLLQIALWVDTEKVTKSQFTSKCREIETVAWQMHCQRLLDTNTGYAQIMEKFRPNPVPPENYGWHKAYELARSVYDGNWA